MLDLKSLTLGELTEYITTLGEPPYRARQIFDFLHKRLVTSFDEMTNIPKSLRARLEGLCLPLGLALEKKEESRLDGTRKYLFSLHDGELIESVLMRYSYGNSVCISSQVGCSMSCRFCASTLGGFKRNLSAAEMLSQVYEIQKDAGVRISHVVVMGIGEPLLNFESLIKFINIISCENSLHISQRNITISTCGIVPRIYDLAKEELNITLAISLHAPNDEIRKSIMPVAKKYSIAELIKAAGDYFKTTKRRVSFEYCLIGGVNDSKENALELARLFWGSAAHVNLIPVNPAGRGVSKPNDARTKEFIQILENKGLNVTKRRELGSDINGACGQLRAKKEAF